MIKNIDKNLFVLTGVGQLRNISGFINQYNATNNIAVVLYTEKNLSVIDNIQKTVDVSQFLDVQFVQLPNNILEEKKRKSILIYNILKDVIKENQKQYQVKNLFLCNVTTYYKFFEKIAKKTMCINLLEEGLTTYRVYLEDNTCRNYKPSLSDILVKFKKIIKSFYIFIKPLLVVFKSIIEFFIMIISFILRKNLLYNFNNFINKLRKYKYGVLTKIDNIYVCYPELIKKFNKNVKNVHHLNFNFKNENIIFTSPEDKENILFINQKYGIRYKEHFPIIFSIFKDMGIKKIYMKFHPRENTESFKEIFEETKSLYPDIQVITLDDFTHIPVENLINSNRITKIIALTSSSLFYSKLVNKDVKTISIAEEYKKRCISYKIIGKRMKSFLHDYDMINKLFNIKQFTCENENNEMVGNKNEKTLL